MKIIDAYWEKRNLGVECKEIQIEKNDFIDDIKNIYKSINQTNYMVARIPSNMVEFYDFFSLNGFRFIESQICIEMDFNKYEVPSKITKMLKDVQIVEMNNIDINMLEKEIINGIFDTDRIFLDNSFSKKNAANRYIFWIRDLINQGKSIYKVLYKEDTIGFEVLSFNNDIVTGHIAGTYNKYKNTGFGALLYHASAKLNKEKGMKKQYGWVSSNNIPVIRICIATGGNIIEIQNVFIKHN